MVVRDHIGRLQVFVIHHVVLAHTGQRRLVVKVLPLPAHLLMRFRQQRDRFASADAALLAPRDAPLGRLQRPFGFAVPAGGEDACAIGEGGECLNAKVDPRLLACGGKGCIGTSAQEKQAYQPSASLEIVTVLGVPSIGRDQRTAMRPILERTRKPLSSVAPLPNSL